MCHLDAVMQCFRVAYLQVILKHSRLKPSSEFTSSRSFKIPSNLKIIILFNYYILGSIDGKPKKMSEVKMIFIVIICFKFNII